MLFWNPTGRILEAFWGHLELKDRLESSLRAVFVLEVDFPGSAHPILKDFGSLLGTFLEIYLYFFLDTDFAIGFHLLLR